MTNKNLKINRLSGEIDSAINIDPFSIDLIQSLLKSGKIKDTSENLNMCSTMDDEFFIFKSESIETIILDLAYLLDVQNFVPSKPSTKTIWNLNSGDSLGPASRFFPDITLKARKANYENSQGLFDKSNNREVLIKNIFDVCKPYHKMV